MLDSPSFCVSINVSVCLMILSRSLEPMPVFFENFSASSSYSLRQPGNPIQNPVFPVNKIIYLPFFKPPCQYFVLHVYSVILIERESTTIYFGIFSNIFIK